MISGQVYSAKHATDGSTIMLCLNSLNPCHIKYGSKNSTAVKYGYIDTTTHSLILPGPHDEKFTDVVLVTYPTTDIKLITGALYNMISEHKTVNVFKVLDAEQKVIELKLPIGGSKQKIIDTTTGQIYSTKAIEHRGETVYVKDEQCLFMPSVVVPAFDRHLGSLYEGFIERSDGTCTDMKFECIEGLIPTLVKDINTCQYYYIGARLEVYSVEYCRVAALCGQTSAYDIGTKFGTLNNCIAVTKFHQMSFYKFIGSEQVLRVQCFDSVSRKFNDAAGNTLYVERDSLFASKVTKFTDKAGNEVLKTFIDRSKKIMDIRFVIVD